MLTLFRRHLKRCTHRAKGRKHRSCQCPLMVEGTLRGTMVRKALDIRSWDAGQAMIREWEATGLGVYAPTVSEAVQAFLKDATARNVRPGTHKNLRVLLADLERYAERKGIRLVEGIDTEKVRELRQGWTFSAITASKKLERLRSFFRFCKDSDWIDANPCDKVRPPKVDLSPTLPFTQKEMSQILAACDEVPDNHHRLGGLPAKRVKALVLLLRHSGLRIGDAVMLPVKNVEGGRLLLYMQKTGVPVHLPLPPAVIQALDALPRANPDYFFWTGESTAHTITGKWRDRLGRVFKLAKIKDGHPHRFRDTFAVELLLKGVPLDQVSILLGHSSVRITERHYSPWVRARQERLEELVQSTWL
jgi:integrase/recombinase XerD